MKKSYLSLGLIVSLQAISLAHAEDTAKDAPKDETLRNTSNVTVGARYKSTSFSLLGPDYFGVPNSKDSIETAGPAVGVENHKISISGKRLIDRKVEAELSSMSALPGGPLAGMGYGGFGTSPYGGYPNPYGGGYPGAGFGMMLPAGMGLQGHAKADVTVAYVASLKSACRPYVGGNVKGELAINEGQASAGRINPILSTGAEAGGVCSFADFSVKSGILGGGRLGNRGEGRALAGEVGGKLAITAGPVLIDGSARFNPGKDASARSIDTSVRVDFAKAGPFTFFAKAGYSHEHAENGPQRQYLENASYMYGFPAVDPTINTHTFKLDLGASDTNEAK